MSDRKIGAPHVIARLLTAAIYFDDEDYWRLLTDDSLFFIEYFTKMGVRLEISQEMGMGFLRPMNSAEEEEFYTDGYAPLPKIIPPRILGYLPSLMCALLREALQRHEENSIETKHLYLEEYQLVDLLRPYLPDMNDDKMLKKEVKKTISRVEEIGVLHRLPNRSEVIYRVEPIIRARIQISQLQELSLRLKEIIKGAEDVAAETEQLEKGDTA